MTDVNHRQQLEGRIQNFIDDEIEAALIKLKPIRSEAIKVGAYDDSRRSVLENQELLKHFREKIAELAWFIFQVEGNEEPAVELLSKNAGIMAERISGHMAKSRLNNGQGDKGRLQRELEERLAVIVADARFDFENGIAGGQVLKKGADINVTNVMNQSPGGVQQGGVGNLTQSAQTELHGTLISALDDIMHSGDFKALESERQDELRDMAEVVRAEVSKPTPDETKIKRWSDRIISKLVEFGLAASASAFGSIVAKLALGA